MLNIAVNIAVNIANSYLVLLFQNVHELKLRQLRPGVTYHIEVIFQIVHSQNIQSSVERKNCHICIRNKKTWCK